MSPRRAVVPLSALLAVVLAGCAGSDDPDPAGAGQPSHSESRPPSGVEPLPIGKADLALDAGVYGSPSGFEPALTIDVPDGWTSVHRGSDGFDFGMADPERDAPLVAVVLLRASEATAAEAVEAVRAAATGRVRDVRGSIGSIAAEGIVVHGGTGELVSSAGLGIALDAAPGQQVQVLAADVGGVPLVEVVLVSDARRWEELFAVAGELSAGVRPA
jgi:hypothetical protein